MGATKTLFEKVGYDPNKLENYGLHYWFQEREPMCLFFLKRRRWVIFFRKGGSRTKKVRNRCFRFKYFTLSLNVQTDCIREIKNPRNSKKFHEFQALYFFVIRDSWNSNKKRTKTMNKESLAARGKNIGISNVEMLRERSVFVLFRFRFRICWSICLIYRNVNYKSLI